MGPFQGGHASVMLRRVGYGRDTDLALRSVFRRTGQLFHRFGRNSGIWYAVRPDVAAVGTSDGYPVYLYQRLAGDRGGRVFIPALHQPARPHFHSMPIAVRPAIPAVRGGSGTTCGRHSFPPSGCLAVLAD